MTAPASPRKDDWVTQLLDKLDEVIEFVRSKTTEPLAKIVRYAVYFALFLVLGISLLTLTLITAVRVLSYIPGPMWTVYAGIAVVFTLFGSYCWRKAMKATR